MIPKFYKESYKVYDESITLEKKDIPRIVWGKLVLCSVPFDMLPTNVQVQVTNIYESISLKEWVKLKLKEIKQHGR